MHFQCQKQQPVCQKHIEFLRNFVTSLLISKLFLVKIQNYLAQESH